MADPSVEKSKIISEIKRTALENEGVALGIEKFQTVTGIKKTAWWGRYWRTWGDALNEAGFSENKLNTAHDKTFLITCLAKLTRTIRRFPTSVDLRLARRRDDTFPSHNSFGNLGPQSARIALVRTYVAEHEEYTDILELLPQFANARELPDKDVAKNTNTTEGFVYMGVLKIDGKKRYKIGKTNLVERRSTELSLQLPEKLELVHCLKTDDIGGIETYWHNRFAEKNTNGEWFNLTSEDVRAFKLRKKFM